MRIKKTSTSNEYLKAGNVWVRNYTKTKIAPISLSHMYSKNDYQMILKNEEFNRGFPKISDENLSFEKVVIVSDGYDFLKRHQLISKFPKDVCILTINGALKDWKLIEKNRSPEEIRTINGYVMNNPYRESLMNFPERNSSYYPVCISSIRGNNEFLKKYKGNVYTYQPTPERTFGYEKNEAYFVDDYRNPVCAAINLAYHFNAKKLMLFCCDESVKEPKDYMVELENGLWTYPQHIRSQQIIDANLYWLTHQDDNEVEVADYSNGVKCNNATYISCEKDALEFFLNQEEH